MKRHAGRYGDGLLIWAAKDEERNAEVEMTIIFSQDHLVFGSFIDLEQTELITHFASKLIDLLFAIYDGSPCFEANLGCNRIA